MNAARIIKRSDLPAGRHRFGTQPSAPKANLQKTGLLNFSKLASEAFKLRKRCVVEFDEQSRRLTFTAVDRLPRGFEEEDCFLICHHRYKGKQSNASITVKRLMSYLKFDIGKRSWSLPVAELDQERCSIAVVLPESVPEAQTGARPYKDAFAELAS